MSSNRKKTGLHRLNPPASRTVYNSTHRKHHHRRRQTPEMQTTNRRTNCRRDENQRRLLNANDQKEATTSGLTFWLLMSLGLTSLLFSLAQLLTRWQPNSIRDGLRTKQKRQLKTSSFFKKKQILSSISSPVIRLNLKTGPEKV